MKYPNRVLMEAFNALVRMGELDDLSKIVMLRVAQNRVFLAPTAKLLDEAHDELLVKFGLKGIVNDPDLPTPERQERQDKFEACQKAITELMEAETEFVAPAAILAKQLNACKRTPKPNDVAACLVVGIILPPESKVPEELQDSDRSPKKVADQDGAI